MHAVRAVVSLLEAVQMRSAGTAITERILGADGGRTPAEREPLPGAVIVWICIQEGASGIPERGTML